jgi:hypothetical protein
MKILALSFFALFVVNTGCLAGDDTNVLAAGDWSAPVAGSEDQYGRGGHNPVIRGRLIFCESPKNQTPALYLELQDCHKAWGGDIEVYCALDGGACRLRDQDASDKPLSQKFIPPRFTNGGMPSTHWITLPSDSTIRLRLTAYAGFYYASTNDYFVSGTFTAAPPSVATDNRLDVWQGTLKLPPVKIVPEKQ